MRAKLPARSEGQWVGGRKTGHVGWPLAYKDGAEGCLVGSTLPPVLPSNCPPFTTFTPASFLPHRVPRRNHGLLNRPRDCHYGTCRTRCALAISAPRLPCADAPPPAQAASSLSLFPTISRESSETPASKYYHLRRTSTDSTSSSSVPGSPSRLALGDAFWASTSTHGPFAPGHRRGSD